MKGKHWEHRFDNSQTEGFVVSLCDRFTLSSNTEFTVHFYLECEKGSKQFLTIKGYKISAQYLKNYADRPKNKGTSGV